MKCDCELCIYNFNNRCSIEDVEISASGMCDSMIFVSITPNQLSEFKKQQLVKYIDKEINLLPAP